MSKNNKKKKGCAGSFLFLFFILFDQFPITKDCDYKGSDVLVAQFIRIGHFFTKGYGTNNDTK